MFKENGYPLPVLFADIFSIYKEDNKLYREQQQTAMEEEGADEDLNGDFLYFMLMQSLHISMSYLEKT